jgi:hypothetical protein
MQYREFLISKQATGERSLSYVVRFSLQDRVVVVHWAEVWAGFKTSLEAVEVKCLPHQIPISPIVRHVACYYIDWATRGPLFLSGLRRKNTDFKQSGKYGDIFPSITNKTQRYTIFLFLWNALHVSGGTSAHHQELKTLYTTSGTCQTLHNLFISVKCSTCFRR